MTTNVLKLRVEHIALNVAEPVAMVEWYAKHLDLKILRQGGPPTHTAFLGDAGRNVAIELYSNTAFPMLDLRALSHMSFHVAFMTENIQKTRDVLLEAGASVVEDVLHAPNGDNLLMMRDPWGVALQFVNRNSPMLPLSHLRPEHAGLNVSDSVPQAQWYIDHLGWTMKRETGAPTHTKFLGDAGSRFMIELYQNEKFPMIDLYTLNHMSFHVASAVSDVVHARQVLQNAGATIEEDVTTTPLGDQVLMLRDPWGLPIQFAKRVEGLVGE